MRRQLIYIYIYARWTAWKMQHAQIFAFRNLNINAKERSPPRKYAKYVSTFLSHAYTRFESN